ncbi:hypothetical protein TTHERM_000372349 (macronuclear) [Tetrahymena thermophila SB210]|uniref:Uncharacterized protein n=1 Tax=Tetrahymena thermophila (strain SB210) TaxID=312017 RepID=W7X9D8_TETTS|nr:hypothetical protein TTHERM_000372349 [Tetrahymena thermophila SB210]EWS76015.1 hypothetical protein TTHERM_000372349 [Tetrahymena thermophila SB210]|eukprot:XP_012651453.1 hypothetical protein TTHERM_000372349 [Tetrahymena thermophila SB210]
MYLRAKNNLSFSKIGIHHRGIQKKESKIQYLNFFILLQQHQKYNQWKYKQIQNIQQQQAQCQLSFTRYMKSLYFK